ncbi:hypothetical protein CLOP_g19687 [Closterium sp. NIES-67]|nr:hypothetical protein CLOP_g19687 [Closterium sp. NIES-67]
MGPRTAAGAMCGLGVRMGSKTTLCDSNRAACDACDDVDTCTWASLPPELLRDVIARVEACDSGWPARRSVVACAGVCRAWRELTRELLQSQASYKSSGQITFPDELRHPGPSDRCVECFIRRSRKTGTFTLFLGVPPNSTENGKFLLAARKCGWRPSSMEYVVSLDPKDFSRGGSSFVGRLRANFLSTRFAVFESSHEPSFSLGAPSLAQGGSSSSSRKVHPGGGAISASGYHCSARAGYCGYHCNAGGSHCSNHCGNHCDCGSAGSSGAGTPVGCSSNSLGNDNSGGCSSTGISSSSSGSGYQGASNSAIDADAATSAAVSSSLHDHSPSPYPSPSLSPYPSPSPASPAPSPSAAARALTSCISRSANNLEGFRSPRLPSASAPPSAAPSPCPAVSAFSSPQFKPSCISSPFPGSGANSSGGGGGGGSSGGSGGGSGGNSGPVVSVAYALNVLGVRGPRRILCTLHQVPAGAAGRTLGRGGSGRRWGDASAVAGTGGEEVRRAAAAAADVAGTAAAALGMDPVISTSDMGSSRSLLSPILSGAPSARLVTPPATPPPVTLPPVATPVTHSVTTPVTTPVTNSVTTPRVTMPPASPPPATAVALAAGAAAAAATTPLLSSLLHQNPCDQEGRDQEERISDHSQPATCSSSFTPSPLPRAPWSPSPAPAAGASSAPPRFPAPPSLHSPASPPDVLIAPAGPSPSPSASSPCPPSASPPCPEFPPSACSSLPPSALSSASPASLSCAYRLSGGKGERGGIVSEFEWGGGEREEVTVEEVTEGREGEQEEGKGEEVGKGEEGRKDETEEEREDRAERAERTERAERAERAGREGQERKQEEREEEGLPVVLTGGRERDGGAERGGDEPAREARTPPTICTMEPLVSFPESGEDTSAGLTGLTGKAGLTGLRNSGQGTSEGGSGEQEGNRQERYLQDGSEGWLQGSGNGDSSSRDPQISPFPESSAPFLPPAELELPPAALPMPTQSPLRAPMPVPMVDGAHGSALPPVLENAVAAAAAAAASVAGAGAAQARAWGAAQEPASPAPSAAAAAAAVAAAARTGRAAAGVATPAAAAMGVAWSPAAAAGVASPAAVAAGARAAIAVTPPFSSASLTRGVHTPRTDGPVSSPAAAATTASAAAASPSLAAAASATAGAPATAAAAHASDADADADCTECDCVRCVGRAPLEPMVLRNKPPRWHEQLQCWCLNFRGRVTVASVKNFQLIEGGPGNDAEKPVLLQFGKIGKDTFTMDYRYPLTAFQAFAICLSSFDTKVACE